MDCEAPPALSINDAIAPPTSVRRVTRPRARSTPLRLDQDGQSLQPRVCSQATDLTSASQALDDNYMDTAIDDAQATINETPTADCHAADPAGPEAAPAPTVESSQAVVLKRGSCVPLCDLVSVARLNGAIGFCVASPAAGSERYKVLVESTKELVLVRERNMRLETCARVTCTAARAHSAIRPRPATLTLTPLSRPLARSPARTHARTHAHKHACTQARMHALMRTRSQNKATPMYQSLA